MASPDLDGPSTSSSSRDKHINLPSKIWDSNRASSPDSPSRSSPEPCCAICLGKPDNKSFTNTCLHQFCFTCLKEWSKVKPECPLCKQRFKAIIHNVRSNDEYEEYRVKSPEPEPPLYDLLRFRFHYRTTVTPERREELAMQRRFAIHRFAQEGILPTERSSLGTRRFHHCRLQGTSAFRRGRYERDLWARPLSDMTGRFREATPEFFRENPAMTHRLVPWLNRELTVLMPHQPNRLAFVLELILGVLNRHHVLSRAFRETMEPYLGENTEHFVHEFYCFARSPYDMFGFDENVQYGPRSTLNHEEVGVSEQSESDIEVLSPQHIRFPSREPSPQPGPSGLQRTYQLPSSGEESSNEGPTISTRRDSVSSGEIKLVKVVKPRRERTPEIITITDSENEAPSRETGERGKSLKRKKSPSSLSSSSSEAAVPERQEERSRKKKQTSKREKRKRSRSRENEKKRRHRERKSRSSRSQKDEVIERPRDERSSAPLRGYWDLEPEELGEYRSGSSTTGSNSEMRDKNKRHRKPSRYSSNDREDKRNRKRFQ